MEHATEAPVSLSINTEKLDPFMQLDLSEMLDESVCLRLERNFLSNLKKNLGMTYKEISYKLNLHKVHVGQIFCGRYPFKVLFLQKLGISLPEIWEKISTFRLGGSKKEFWLPKQIPLTEEFAWLLGYWLGDKNSANDGIGVTDTSLTVLGKFAKVLEELGINRIGLRVYVNYTETPNLGYIANCLGVPRENLLHIGRTCKTLTVTVMFYSRLWARIFLKIAEKVETLLDAASPNMKGAFVGGFIDAEGNCKTNIMIPQANRRTLVVIMKILRDLGFKIKKIKFSHHLFYINISPIGDALDEFLKFVKLVNPRKRRDVEHLIYHIRHIRREKVLSFQVLGFMKRTGHVTIRDIANKFGLSYHAAQTAFQRLRKKGLICKVGKRESLDLFSLALSE